MSDHDSDKAAFEATLAALALPTAASIELDATVVPDELASWTSYRDGAPLPSMRVRFAEGHAAVATVSDASAAEIELLELLGEGGMGHVYRATQRSLNREVAVKILKQASSPRAVAALCDEAVVTGRLSHPNVIPVHALGDAGDGRPLLIMKRVEGVGWNMLLRADDHPFWTRTKVAADDRLHFHLEVLRKVTHAVAFAHSHGIVHRDIKPENVMIGEFGEVYLVDWGIAVKAGTAIDGRLAGTPAYLAPEMIDGVVDERTDVYLLGATLHEILTGAPPHRGATLHDVLSSANQSRPPSFAADVPTELADLCTRALARDSAARPASAHAFGQALDDHVRHRGSRALARTGEERLAQLRRVVQDVAPAARDLAEIRRLVAESRFAFLEARRGWAENPAVAPGLAESLTLAVRVELDRRDAEAARAMLRELEQPDPVLAREVTDLEAALARENREHARLAQLAKDLDPEVESGARVIAAGVVVACVIAFSIYVALLDQFTLTHVFGLGVGLNGMLAVLLVVLWPRIKRTVFNKRMAAWGAVAAGTVLAHRALALFEPSATVDTVLRADLLILATTWMLGSIFLFRWMLPVGIGLALSTIPTFVAPSVTPVVFTTANMLAIGSFIVGWRHRRRAPAVP